MEKNNGSQTRRGRNIKLKEECLTTQATEKKGFISPWQLVCHPMGSAGGNGRVSFNGINMEGSNVGSVMTMRRVVGEEKGSADCGECSINIYVSNNIQGVNNSILVGSKVVMAEPQLRLCVEDLLSDELARRKKRNKIKRKRSNGRGGPSWVVFWFVVALFISYFLLWVSFTP